MWIERDLIRNWAQASLPVRILRGLRQSGKTSFLEHASPEATIARLDDFSTRRMANEDPALFFKTHSGRPLIIDEAQYAPGLFAEIKLLVDLARRDRLKGKACSFPLFLISGSNQTLLNREVRESLAGRASIFCLHTLSLRELLKHRPDYETFEYFLKGGWPELQVDRELSERRFLDDYVSSFLAKDIASSAGVAKLRSFETALGLLAARTAQQLNASEIASQVGVDASTLSGWVSILEQNLVIGILKPYHSNLSKRLVKSPKLYFLETSLATRLQGWTQLEPLLKSPAAGALFETLVYGELVRTLDHGVWNASLWYLRTRDGEEIDFLIQGPNARWLLLEAKLGVQSTSPIRLSSEITKVIPANTPSWVVTAGGAPRMLSQDCEQVPVTLLADRLDEWLTG